MEKFDVIKSLKSEYKAGLNPEFVNISKAVYLSITGKGDPSGEPFNSRIQALYTTIYTLKFQCKATGNDFIVSKLECQWWFNNEKYNSLTMAEAPVKIPRSEWEYRLLIRLPHFVTDQMVNHSKDLAIKKKENLLISDVQYFELSEGLSVQMLHIGPFSREPETLSVMLQFMHKHKLLQNGFHHEIYLSDFRRTAPEKLKTVLREPVALPV